MIMSSLRRPVKITVVGNDGCSYGFLVKAGEDLRQDERVQQLFGVMNEVLSQDSRCTALKLHINTYQVVPLNSHLGIIEFVKECVPYGDFIQSNATELQNVHMDKAKKSYSKWTESKSGSKSPSVKYDSLYMKYSQKVSMEFFATLLKKMPENLLRQAFSRVSSSPEGLFWLRQSFASSIGVMNVAQWLLGIGDRHLSNMLVSQRTGAALGIDFGHAFGSATQLLPVPELVPFRLTEYMLALMGPLRHSGLIRASMIHSLRALRSNSELLLNTMQVFVQEPSLDWQENAVKLADNFAPDSEASEIDSLTVSQEVQNYAEQKVKLTQCKIEGALPVVVTEKELVTGRKNVSAALPFIVKVLRGDDTSLRARLREKARQILEDEIRADDLDNLVTCSFTPEQQVDCLIEQAKDHSILARTWEGWESWV